MVVENQHIITQIELIVTSRELMDSVEMVSLLDIMEFMDSKVFSKLLWVM